VIDIEKLLREVSIDSPAGDNLEYDADFTALELSAQGSQDQTIGDAVISGTPPDWRAVRSQAVDLFGRTKDLRVALYLLRALLNLEGIAGFASGMALLRRLLERYWPTLHPELDPDDRDDPTRVNIIITLCDRNAVLNALQMAPLVSSRGLGRFGLRHIRIAREEIAVPANWEGPVPDLASVKAAFMECDVDELQATAAALSSARKDLEQLDRFLMESVGSASAPDLGSLGVELRDAQAIVAEYLAARGVGAGQGDEAVAGSGAASPEGAGAAAAAPRPIAGDVSSREDAIKALDKIAEYFTRHEPSSPVPMILARAKRLVGMDFLEIINEIAPDGVRQVKDLGGIVD